MNGFVLDVGVGGGGGRDGFGGTAGALDVDANGASIPDDADSRDVFRECVGAGASATGGNGGDAFCVGGEEASSG